MPGRHTATVDCQGHADQRIGGGGGTELLLSTLRDPEFHLRADSDATFNADSRASAQSHTQLVDVVFFNSSRRTRECAARFLWNGEFAGDIAEAKRGIRCESGFQPSLDRLNLEVTADVSLAGL
jgi:hypothetical protein